MIVSLLLGQPADDPWNFDDAPVEERLTDVLVPQMPEVAALAAFLLLAYVSFRRKNPALRYLTLVLAVGYMGFYKSQLLSIVNVVGVLDWSWPIAKHAVAWYLLFGFMLLSTVLWGRFYCGRICAFGALTQLMDAVIPKRFRYELPKAVDRKAIYLKYVVLAGSLGYYFMSKDMMFYRYVEPFWMFGLAETTPMWIGLGVLLAATVFVRNLYCRYLCPLGATIGLLSNLTVFRIKRWQECRTCRICEKACEYNAIRGPKILVTECVRCDDCERLYEDRGKCPHWLIIQRKDDVLSGRVRGRGQAQQPIAQP